MRTCATILLVFAACGGGDDGGVVVPDAARPDADVSIDADPTCDTWTLTSISAARMALIDPVAPIEGRSLRLVVGLEVNACDEPAMTSVVQNGASVTITPRVWRRPGAACPPTTMAVERPVVLDLAAGTWTISAPGVDDLVVDVAATALACDPTRARCQLDCDCDEDAGERCLGYSGLAGPTTDCARPCEASRDCGGNACEGEVDDGLSYRCTNRPECGPTAPCAVGWTCEVGVCTPDFTLDGQTRHPCACDADCEPGTRCANPSGEGPRQCEALCPTDGPWCQGAHACGVVDAVAHTDAICGWLGE